MVSVSVRYLFYHSIDEKVKTWTLRFPAKENPNMKKALFDWPIVLQYYVKAKYRLISSNFSSMKFFYPSVPLTYKRPRAFVSINPSNRSISVCFFVSVLFARFHIKVTRKSLYNYLEISGFGASFNHKNFSELFLSAHLLF